MHPVDRLVPPLIRAAIRHLPPRGRGIELAHRWTARRGSDGHAYRSREPSGMRLVCDLRDDVSRVVYYRGWVHEPTDSWLTRWLSPGDTYVDVGAHIGSFVSRAAARVGPTGRIVAFEPSPGTYAKLAAAVSGRPELEAMIEMHRMAAGDAPGEMEINVPEDQTAHATLVAVAGSPGNTRVEVARLDDVLDERPVRLLKIDTEGYEPAVLRGASRTLERCDAVLIELNPEALTRAGSSPTEVAGTLTGMGFTPHRLLPGGTLQRASDMSIEGIFVDMAFIHDRAARR